MPPLGVLLLLLAFSGLFLGNATPAITQSFHIGDARAQRGKQKSVAKKSTRMSGTEQHSVYGTNEDAL